MSYKLDFRAPLEETVRAVGLDQADRAIQSLQSAGSDPDEAVHEARKRCKKIRALLRLVRSDLPGYHALNARFRDAAATLAAERDATVVKQTLANLIDEYREPLDDQAFFQERESLELLDKAVTGKENTLLEKIREACHLLEACRHDVARLTLDSAAGRKTWLQGARRTYRRGRKAFHEAYESGDPDAFHEWRKRVKYHAHHMKLLRPLWPKVLKARYTESKALGDLLGEDHDLHVLLQVLKLSPDDFTDDRHHALLHELVRARQDELRQTARLLGDRLYAEKPGVFIKRLSAWT